LLGKLLKAAAIITSIPICGFILFLITMKDNTSIRTYQYFTSNLNGTTKGTIVSSEVLKRVDKYKTTYHVITYTYEVNNQKYLSDLFNFKDRSFGNSREIVHQYPPGKEVLVWYDTDSPDIGVVEKSGPTPGLILMTMFHVLFACLGFLLNPLIWIAFGKKYRKNKYQR